MTVQNPGNKTTPQNGDGVTLIFSANDIKLIDPKTDLLVYIIDNTGVLNLQTVDVDYTIDYDDDTEDSVLTFAIAPAADEQVFAIREREQTQPFDIPINSDFDAEKIETADDNLSIQISDIQEQVSRSLRLPETFTGDFVANQEPVDDNLLVFVGTDGTMTNSGTTLTDIVSGATDAAASAAAAAASAANAATSESNASTSETNAAASAAAAATSESNAATSEANAAASAAAAEVAKIEWQGTYSGATTYAQNDAVEYNGSSYISLVDSNTGNQPDISPVQWDLLAEKGQDGAGGTTAAAPESFVATAAQTNFTLAGTPVAAWVWKNGAAQDASTWSISGDDIVLSTAADAGDLIEVYFLTDAGQVIVDAQTIVLVNDQTGSSYTLVLDDASKKVRMDNALSNTVTVPTNASVAYAIGTVIYIHQTGAGQTQVVPDVGVTINYTQDSGFDEDKLAAQNATCVIHQVATDEWDISGALVQ